MIQRSVEFVNVDGSNVKPGKEAYVMIERTKEV